MEIGCFAGLFALGTATAALADATLSEPSVRRVLERDPIHICATGLATVPFPAIAEGLTRTNLIADVQRTYALMLPAGRQPEFVVVQTASNAYHYSNRHGEHSDIREVSRQQMTQDCIRCVYYVEGRRFFGPFESVIQVEVRQAEAGVTGYEVNVYAHADVAVARFMARHLPFIESYFQHKTREIVGLMAEIVKASVTGVGTNGAAGANDETGPCTDFWTPTIAGSHALTAIARDNAGHSPEMHRTPFPGERSEGTAREERGKTP